MTAGNHAVLKVLELGKSFSTSTLNRVPYSRKFLHGTTKDGTPVTLWKCITTHRSRSMSSEETHFDVHNVIFGGHFTESNLVFDGIQTTLDYLNDWMGYSRFQTQDLTADKNSSKQINILFEGEHRFPFQAPEYKSAKFFLGYQSDISDFKFSIRSLANLQITYEAPKPLDDLLKHIRQWSWFLTLATDHPTHPTSIVLSRDDLRPFPGIVDYKEPHDVWIESMGIRKSKKTIHDPDMVFTFSDVKNDLSNVVSRWNAMQAPWAAVLHRYFAATHRQGLQLQEEFLFLAQATEALHRTKTGAVKVFQKEAYDAAWENAPKSLKSRLGAKDAFIEEVRINRNYLTHYSPDDEPKAADIAELFELTQQLGFILRAAILTEIGIDGSIVEASVDADKWGTLVDFDEGD